jgi:hypothetical protein
MATVDVALPEPPLPEPPLPEPPLPELPPLPPVPEPPEPEPPEDPPLFPPPGAVAAGVEEEEELPVPPQATSKTIQIANRNITAITDDARLFISPRNCWKI